MSGDREGGYLGPGVVLRVGELFLKGKNRHLFEEALERNVRRAMSGRDDLRVIGVHGRIFILGAADRDVLDRTRWIFGISSCSPAVFCDKSTGAITGTALELAGTADRDAVKTFRIAARRSDKSFEWNSAKIGREVGAAVAVETGFGVDLERPDLTIGVEVGKTWTFLWVAREQGAGGLPVGVSGKVMLLLSGGIDSPVAGHMMQKRGLELEATYFHAFPYTGDGARKKVEDLARVLAARQSSLRLNVIQFAAIQEAFRDGADPSYLVLLYRRAMIRIAARLAEDRRIRAIATGESLGQVASQTLANMATVEAASPLPVLRPLIGFDKQETIDLARKIGTFDISIQPHDDCCTLFVPKHPQTRGLAHKARSMEDRVEGLDALLAEAAGSAEITEI